MKTQKKKLVNMKRPSGGAQEGGWRRTSVPSPISLPSHPDAEVRADCCFACPKGVCKEQHTEIMDKDTKQNVAIIYYKEVPLQGDLDSLSFNKFVAGVVKRDLEPFKLQTSKTEGQNIVGNHKGLGKFRMELRKVGRLESSVTTVKAQNERLQARIQAAEQEQWAINVKLTNIEEEYDSLKISDREKGYRIGALERLTHEHEKFKEKAEVQLHQLNGYRESFQKVRRRIFEVFRRDILKHKDIDMSIIQEGNLVAHDGDALGDASLWDRDSLKPGTDPAMKGPSLFNCYYHVYGCSPGFAREIQDSTYAVELLNIRGRIATQDTIPEAEKQRLFDMVRETTSKYAHLGMFGGDRKYAFIDTFGLLKIARDNILAEEQRLDSLAAQERRRRKDVLATSSSSTGSPSPANWHSGSGFETHGRRSSSSDLSWRRNQPSLRGEE